MHHDQALERLRLQGHRLTPQRILVLSVMSEGRQHMGVDEVFRRAREAYQYMDIATVYRTLRLFKEAGVVTEVEIGDRLHYELTLPGDRHHHMVCRICSGAYNLSPITCRNSATRWSMILGFSLTWSTFSVTGDLRRLSGAERWRGGVAWCC